jgi:polar amino acid transport system permease protein
VLAADWERLQRSFFRWDIAQEQFPDIVVVAAKNTVVYTAIAFVGGLLLGLIFAIMKLSTIAPYRWLATIYIEVFRGLPALLTIFTIAFVLPIALGIRVPGGAVGAGVVGLILVAGAYMAETIRAGIQAVPKGQIEAARSLGMTPARTMLSIVLPQAFRLIIPPLTNEFVLLIKDTSLLYIAGSSVTTKELTTFARGEASLQSNATPLLVAGVLYLVITIPLTRLVAWLERRQQRAR